MDATNFCYWLHGHFELGGGPPTAAQWKTIEDHLDLVFNKVTPTRDTQPSLGHPQPSGILTIEATHPLQFTSGDNSFSYEDWLKKDNSQKVFITVSREPIFNPDLSYSYYRFEATGQSTPRSLLEAHGIDYSPHRVFLTVDNTLNPTPTTFNDLRGSSKHLTMPSPGGIGLLNVGIDHPLAC